jgi:hypothetical protein
MTLSNITLPPSVLVTTPMLKEDDKDDADAKGTLPTLFPSTVTLALPVDKETS